MSGAAPATRIPTSEHWSTTLRRWLTVELGALAVVAALTAAFTALTGDVSKERLGVAFAIAGFAVGVLGLVFCFQRLGATNHYHLLPGYTPTVDLELATSPRRWAEMTEVMLLTFPVCAVLLLTASVLGAGR
jgi:FtsH-binding integral membrane protein